jgi:phytoene desaturase
MRKTVMEPAPTTGGGGAGQRVVIVGAGPGGLASALLLAHAGLDVTIVERFSRVGGRTSALEVPYADGRFRFDVGPTFFLYPLVLERIFKAVGRDLWTDVPMQRLDPQYRILFGDNGELLCTPDVAQLTAAVAKIAPDDAPHVARFLDENRVKLARFRPVLESPFSSWRDLLRWDVLKTLPLLRPWQSLDTELGRYFRDPRVRLAFSFQSKYLGMSPFTCPSLFSILSFLEYEYGVWHPTGGCSAVSERMATIAEQMGVRIRLGEDVQEVLCDGRRAVGVRTQTATYPADALVINADFARAMQRLVPERLRRRWSDPALEKKRYSCSTFMLYLGIRGRYDELAHHTIYTSKNYLQNLHDIETGHVLSDDPSVYVQNACVTDPSLAPAGHSTLYVLAPVTHEHPNVDWQQEAPRFRALVLRQLAKLGLPDVESRIVHEQMLTPRDWRVGYEIFRGATFNLAHNLGQMLHYRPNNRFEELDGVYLAGGGTHPGSGLPVIYESARISARLLLNDLGHDAGWVDRAASPAASALAGALRG